MVIIVGINWVNQVQIPDKAVYMSLHINTLEKNMNLHLLFV